MLHGQRYNLRERMKEKPPRSDRGKSHGVRKAPTPFKPKSEELKFIPDSLRFVLTACRVTFDNGKQVNDIGFATILNQSVRPGRLRLKRITRRFIARVEDGDIGVQYAHLEAYSRALDIPCGYLLLISRIYSEFTENGAEDANEILDRLKVGIDALRKSIGSDSIQTEDGIRLLLDAYRSDAADRSGT